MPADKGYQQREENPHQGASHSFGRPSETANRTETSARSDQERAIQTGRDTTRSTAISRRAQTQPVYGPGAGLFTPFRMMRRMAEDMDRLFEDFGLGRTSIGLLPTLGADLDRDLVGGTSTLNQAAWTPQIETFRRGNKLVIRADLPGLRKEDVRVELEDGALAISGERHEEHEEERDDFYRSERAYGRFYRAIPLPDGVNENQVDASFKDGVLEVSVPAPKQEERKAKQIQVK